MPRPLRELIGCECELAEVGASLCAFARETGAPVIGALEVTCSDEAEHECTASFQTEFVDQNLPPLKPHLRAAFCTANLGARYEWGSIRLAEQHFATQASEHAFKLLVVKLNAHVSAVDGPVGPTFGPLRRYDTRSTACGALYSLLRGEELPAIKELRQLFKADGNDRIATLLDPTVVPPDYRLLFAAIVGAELQSRRAVNDILEYKPHSPTLYLVVPCVTLNRSEAPDTELVCGYFAVDCRKTSQPPQARYTGLHDDPAAYGADVQAGRLRVRSAES